MKSTKTVESSVCDFCPNDASGWSKCVRCKKDICYDCQKTRAVKYNHAVHCSGSGDGLYCLDCDRLEAASPSPLWAAYIKIQSLSDETRRFYEDFEIRAKLAEKTLKELQK